MRPMHILPAVLSLVIGRAVIRLTSVLQRSMTSLVAERFVSVAVIPGAMPGMRVFGPYVSQT